MSSLLQRIKRSPVLVRVVPFAIFVGLTFLQGQLGEAARYWVYFLKTVMGAWLVWWIAPEIAEMRWRLSWEGIAVGVAVFVVWVGLDSYYPKFGGAGKPWNPQQEFGPDSELAYWLIATRIVGSTVIVPPLEEVFYRSFLYRYIVKPDFQTVALGYFGWTPFFVIAAIFGFAHFEWLAAILCALAYQGLVVWKNRLGDAMAAHAVTNLLLGLWVVWKGAWSFW